MQNRQDSFVQQLSEATEAFTDFTAAYAQLENGDDYINLHILAPEIVKQFGGTVQFGIVARGTLFYDSFLDVSSVHFTVFYYDEPGALKTVRVDFYGIKKTSTDLKPIARFIARIDAKKLPPLRPGVGKGKWQEAQVASCASTINRQSESTLAVLTIPPIRQEADFSTLAKGSIDISGYLIFGNLKKIENPPPCVVHYRPDIILFHRKGSLHDIIATFFPTVPIDNFGEEPIQEPIATWRKFKPPPDEY